MNEPRPSRGSVTLQGMFRKSRGLQRQLSTKHSVKQSTLSRLSHGWIKPNESVKEMLELELGIGRSWWEQPPPVTIPPPSNGARP